jgi:glutaredoxin
MKRLDEASRVFDSADLFPYTYVASVCVQLVFFMVNSVTLFYNETCSTCLQARDRMAGQLAAANIPFTVKEVSNDVNNRDYLILSSGQIGSPVVLVDKREVVGIDRARLKRLIGVDVGPDHPAHW